ncbi:hypothetical protein PF002_g17895 [Phytophthora fragariae]|uniref:Uncharacterized protein n=1 Tax=Phytophthora fragariae TaxID=53985 RepID=A0A6A3Y7S9_9STRA|nr:hypothetical protein PF002_g17895 [Phytophthora fragariae]
MDVCDGVKESPVGRVDEPEGVAVLGESVACPEASEFVEEKTDDEKKESIARVEKVITVNETVAEELKESAVASVPKPVDESGLKTVPNEGDEVGLSGETVKDERGGTVEPLPLKRLFSDDELGAMEKDTSTVPKPLKTHSTSVIVERFGLPPEDVEKIKKNVLPDNGMNAKDAEAVAYSNIGVPASDGTVENSAKKDREDGEEPTVETSPLVIRALGREAVYEWLKKTG